MRLIDVRHLDRERVIGCWELDDVLRVLADGLAQVAAADPVPGLEHLDVEPRTGQLAGRRQPRETRTDNHHVAVMHRSKYPDPRR